MSPQIMLVGKDLGSFRIPKMKVMAVGREATAAEDRMPL